MIQSITLCCILFIFICVNAEPVDNQWKDFKINYGKTYSSPREEENRMEIFKTNLENIRNHNEKYERGEVTYKMGVTTFSDMLKEEFIDAYKIAEKTTGFRKAMDNIDFLFDEDLNDDDYPDSFDWRDKGAVLPPGKNGVLCSAEWAFSIAGTVESYLYINNGTLEQMSPQYIIDCCSFSDGCNVAKPLNDAYRCLEINGGVSSVANYVYFNGDQGKCLNRPNFPIRFSSMFNVKNETRMQALLVNTGPLNAVVDASSLHSYSSGIISESDCNDENGSSLAVIIVGYGTDNSTDYWTIKNAWGTDWGEEGYFRVVRNRKACGVHHEIFFPVLDS